MTGVFLKSKVTLIRRVVIFIICGWVGSIWALEILTAGDSITQGLQRTSGGATYGITFPVNGAANVGGYQSRLNSKLDVNIEASTVYNWGVAGENSIGGANRTGSILSSRFADYILIMYGANDLYQGVSSSANKANIRSMISQSRARNVTPIIAEITPNNSFNSAIEGSYNPQIRSLAVEENVPIALMHQNLNSGWNFVPYHSGDGLHLSNAGYDKMTSVWFAAINENEFEPALPNTQPNTRFNIVPILDLLLFD